MFELLDVIVWEIIAALNATYAVTDLSTIKKKAKNNNNNKIKQNKIKKNGKKGKERDLSVDTRQRKIPFPKD